MRYFIVTLFASPPIGYLDARLVGASVSTERRCGEMVYFDALKGKSKLGRNV